MKFHFLGHSCFIVEIAGKRLLFDPFFGANPKNKEEIISDLNIDYILVSHGHQDHTADLVEVALATKVPVLAAFEITTWCQNQGIEDVHPFNFGGQRMYDFGTVKFVQAQHSSVLPDGTYAGNPGGFVISTEKTNFYYSGDTALTMDMQLIPSYANIDCVILPIGDIYTMGIDDAILASDFVKCDTIIGVHFDSFPDIQINHLQAKEKCDLRNKKLILPEVNQTIEL